MLEAYSVSHGKASPYLPVIELLKSYFRHSGRRMMNASGGRRSTGKVLMLDRSLEDTLPYLFALLGIEEQPSPLQQMDPQIRRRRTFEALKKLFLRESLNQPLILIFEDLHWIDSETQGFLDTLSESVASAKVLLLVNYRPEYRHEWGQKTYYTQLRLAPLGKAEAEEFCLRALPAGRTVMPALSSPQAAHSGEDRRHAVFHGRGGADVRGGRRARRRTRPVPAHAARPPHADAAYSHHRARRAGGAHRPPRARRESPAATARGHWPRVSAESDPPGDHPARRGTVSPAASLQRKEFLYEQPAFPEVEYIFKHALTQEVAYGTVLQERRKVLHERTAQAIEALYRANLEDHYSDLAHHYSRSGNTAEGRGVSQPGGTASGAAVGKRGSHQPPHHGS